MKSRILVLLLALMLLLLCSCKHSHEFDDAYSSDDVYHWHACSGCDEKADVEQHKWNSGTVTLHPTTESEGERTYTCNVCRATKIEKIDKLDPSHVHAYDTKASDEYSHWNECLCGEKETAAPHTWDNGATESGLKTYTCTDCGHKYTEVVTSGDGMSFMKSAHHRMTDKLPKNPLTLEAEILIPTTFTGRAGAIFSNYIGVRQDWHFEIFDNGVPRFYYHDASGAVRDVKFNNVKVNTGEWVRIAFTFDYANRTMSLYLDGQLAQTVACDYDLATDATRYKFHVGGDGRNDNSQYFKGQIRSIAVYSDVRTAEEIAKSAQNGTNVYADDLLVAYQLNENSGKNDIIDLSPNGYEIAKEWLDSHTPSIDYAYSFAVIGDTQWLVQNVPHKMEGIYDWILANKDEKKIAHVFGLGDITEEWGNSKSEAEWIKAQQYISKLDGKIPYSLIRGNHDESSYFFKYFDNDTYKSQFDGFMSNINNSYKKMRIGSTDYLFLTLDFGASDEMLEWANEIVLAHPNHRVVVTTHGYQGFDGGHLSFDNNLGSNGTNDGSDVDPDGIRNYNDGKGIWEKFISNHPNIFLVMSGHTPDEDILLLQSEGKHGNIVNQMLIDAQWMDPQKGGVGMVAMFYFSEDGTQMEVEWISTDTGKYYKEYNQFTLDLTNSFNAPTHSFSKAYNEKYHYMACECGYTYDEKAHEFGNGVTNSNGDTEYTCSCGYVKVIPLKATTTFVTPDGEILDVVYTNANDNGLYYVTAPTLNGYVAEYDRLILDPRHDSLNVTVYCSPLSVWDGVSVSTGLKGSGTQADPFLIESGADLAYIANEVNKVAVKTAAFFGKYFKMTQSIDLGGHALYIGGSSEWGTRQIFAGYFDGNHCTIRGLNNTKSLFAAVEGGYLKNFSVYGKVNGNSTVGGIVGYVANGGMLENLTNYVTVTGVSGLGGLVANAENHSSTVLNCVNYGDVTGSTWNIGGIAGSAGHDIIGCVNYGNISSTGNDNVGGIAGTTKNTGSISDCINYGNISTTKGRAGGIVGLCNKPIVNCINYGNVNGGWDSAGILGYVADNGTASVINCINNGTVTGGAGMGGIVGYNKIGTLTVTDCINNGIVNGSWGAGGIAGNINANSVIEGCVNNGQLNAQGELGGIVGKCSGKVTGCTNKGNVVGTADIIGGIVGHLHNTTHVDTINNTNHQEGTVTGPNSQQIIGKQD